MTDQTHKKLTLFTFVKSLFTFVKTQLHLEDTLMAACIGLATPDLDGLVYTRIRMPKVLPLPGFQVLDKFYAWLTTLLTTDLLYENTLLLIILFILLFRSVLRSLL